MSEVNKDLTTWSNEELTKQLKHLKSLKVIDAALVGLLVGVGAYSTFMTGFRFFSVLPFIMTIPIVRGAAKKKAQEKEIREELHSRNLL